MVPHWAGAVVLGKRVRWKARGGRGGTGSMGKSLQKMICNDLFLSDGGMIHSTFFAGKSSSCRAANSL